jgi:hypothetical protein
LQTDDDRFQLFRVIGQDGFGIVFMPPLYHPPTSFPL